MKEVTTTILTFVLYISLIIDYGLGIIHSFTKHGVGDGIAGTILFPWAMYRGVEYFWHDDYSDVNWDQRLNNDLQTCIYFIESISNKDSDKYKINQNIEEFSEKIKDYPTEKRRYLLEGTKKYINYSKSLTIDFVSALNAYKNDGNFNFITSDKTNNLEIELSKYKLTKEIQIFKKGIEEVNKQMQNDLPRDTALIDQNKIKEIEETMKLTSELHDKEFKRIFKSIFNQDL